VNQKLSELGQIIEKMQLLSEKLLVVLEKQTKAVVATDLEQIEQNAEEYTSLKGAFKNQENKFIEHLKKIIVTAGEDEAEVRLEELKKLYPEAYETIEGWKQKLQAQIQQLKQKHKQLNELLSFALNRNVELMRSIYSMHNQNNTHYSQGGNKEEISSGIAVNKQA